MTLIHLTITCNVSGYEEQHIGDNNMNTTRYTKNEREERKARESVVNNCCVNYILVCRIQLWAFTRLQLLSAAITEHVRHAAARAYAYNAAMKETLIHQLIKSPRCGSRNGTCEQQFWDTRRRPVDTSCVGAVASQHYQTGSVALQSRFN